MFGFEARGHWTNLSNSHISLFNSTFTDSTKVQGLGLFTGQVGYAWNGMSTRYDVSTTIGGVSLACATGTRWGGTLGVGFECGFAPNWSAGIEYDHLFIGNANNSFSGGLLLRSIRLTRTWIWSPHA